MNTTYGIALSGGGARGLAHAGVLKALNEFGIYPNMISGVSAGAIVGLLYADGFSPDEILEIFIKKDLLKLLKIKRPKLGFFSAEGLKNILTKTLRSTNFSDLNTPLAICATNLYLARAEYFTQGSVVDAVLASSAFPILVKPYQINSTLYVDGGLMDNLPVKPLMGLNDKVIGVYVNPIVEEQTFKSARQYADRILHIGLRANVLKNIELCDLFIEPKGLSKFNLFKVANAHQIFDEGYQFTKQYLVQQKILENTN